MTFEAVTFDFWNTLVPETKAPVEARRLLWAEVIADAGHEVTESQLDAAFRYGWEQFDRRWRSNVQSSAAEVTADAVTKLPFAVNATLEAQLADAYLAAGENTPRELAADVEETLDRLRGLGLAVGVICDVGTVPSARLHRWLDELGVHHLINHFSFSDDVGVYKPHPEIFHHALDGLGVTDPGRAAHVGDIKRTDIAGARAAGMTSVRFTGVRVDDEDGDDADHVIAEHLDLLDVLGLR